MKRPQAGDYVAHMLEAIDRIQIYTAGLTEADFRSSQLVQDAVIRNFEVIGEAAGNLLNVAPEIATSHPEIPWHLPRGMRNFLAHVYWSIDAATIWSTVTDDLPAFRQQIETLRRELASPEGPAEDGT